MTTMRAKMYISSVEKYQGGEKVNFAAIGRSGGYPADGGDEDNTYAKYTPSADAHFHIQNPALFDQFKPGDKFYVDFTPAPA